VAYPGSTVAAVADPVEIDRDSDLKKLFAHVSDPPPKLRSRDPDLTRALEEVLDRALAKDRDKRQQSAGEFASSAFEALES